MKLPDAKDCIKYRTSMFDLATKDNTWIAKNPSNLYVTAKACMHFVKLSYQRSEENSVSQLSRSVIAECNIAFPWFLNTQISSACHRIGSRPVFDELELFISLGADALGLLSFFNVLNDFAITFPYS